jgi:EAL domain-containing protein (putative c-di-GMP-specific phosphodiesterase class I)
MSILFEGKALNLVFQPKWDIRKNIIGAEVLLRTEKGGSPMEILDKALHQEMTVELTRSVLIGTAKQMRAWQEKGISLPLSVNVYVKDLSFEMLEFIEKVFHAEGLPLMFLSIELLENQILYAEKRPIIQAFRDKDIEVLLDDFGGGVHTWGTIDEWQDVLDGVKIDKSVVDRGEADAYVDLLLKKDLGVEVEGIEKEEQYRNFPSEVKLQGFYLSEPLVVEEFERFVQEFVNSV